MPNQTDFNILIDADIKADAEKIFAQCGLDMSTAVSLFLEQVICEGGLPFEVTTA